MDTISIFHNCLIRLDYFTNCKLGWKTIRNKKDGSIKYILYFNNLTILYCPQYRYLKITTSITKFLYKDNSKLLFAKDLSIFCLELNFIIRNKLRLREIINNKETFLPKIENWSVSRLDLVSNFYCHNQTEKLEYITLLKKLNFPYCKKDLYSESVHAHNKSRCSNFYDKNAESPNLVCSHYILRLELQLKNSAINQIIRDYNLPSKKLADIFDNLDKLELVFFNHLDKLGLFKRFLKKEYMLNTLSQLFKNCLIGKTKYKNLCDYIFNESKSFSKTAIYNYRKLLSALGFSHIVSDQNIKHKLDFKKFNLFKNDHLKSSFDLRLKIEIYLYLINLLARKTYYILFKTLSSNLTRPPKLAMICDDS
ncbi:hypothetical protein [Clostridium felsineum]|uniref:hypothetical protein n=1 Tax=Clostridium felsineum TaxID=36839 RepID=UPI00098C1DF6|nr:hypothetical protein [Clostridium felsineum]URZ01935.1 hypothetical protein CLAUR_019320 [Clostridium felsineum]